MFPITQRLDAIYLLCKRNKNKLLNQFSFYRKRYFFFTFQNVYFVHNSECVYGIKQSLTCNVLSMKQIVNKNKWWKITKACSFEIRKKICSHASDSYQPCLWPAFGHGAWSNPIVPGVFATSVKFNPQLMLKFIDVAECKHANYVIPLVLCFQ